MKETKITLEEHKKLGAILKILNKKLKDNFKLSKYRTKEQGRKSHEWKALNLLSKFKSELEEIMIKDYPKYLDTGIYYRDSQQ